MVFVRNPRWQTLAGVVGYNTTPAHQVGNAGVFHLFVSIYLSLDRLYVQHADGVEDREDGDANVRKDRGPHAGDAQRA